MIFPCSMETHLQWVPGITRQDASAKLGMLQQRAGNLCFLATHHVGGFNFDVEQNPGVIRVAAAASRCRGPARSRRRVVPRRQDSAHTGLRASLAHYRYRRPASAYPATAASEVIDERAQRLFETWNTGTGKCWMP